MDRCFIWGQRGGGMRSWEAEGEVYKFLSFVLQYLNYV